MKAGRHWHICPLSGPSQKQITPACVLKPQALICSRYRVCAHVCVYHCVGSHVHIYGVCEHACIISVCLYTVYIQYTGKYVH